MNNPHSFLLLTLTRGAIANGIIPNSPEIEEAVHTIEREETGDDGSGLTVSEALAVNVGSDLVDGTDENNGVTGEPMLSSPGFGESPSPSSIDSGNRVEGGSQTGV